MKLKRGVKAADVVAWLRSIRWARAKDFLRTRVDLDRAAVIKAVQTDEFFINTGIEEEELRKELASI